jgi:hypothetical protein
MVGGYRYNENMDEHRYLPDPNRLSVLTAVILLAFSLTRLIALPPFVIQTSIFDVDLTFRVTASSIVSFLAAGLTATGMDWLLRSHPLFHLKNTVEHLILPALTAWIIGITIYSFSENLYWWMFILFGGIFLVLIGIAEYIATDPTDVRYGIATAALTAISFVLLLVLVVALRTVGVRLFVLLPILILATGLVSLRTLHLRTGGKWEYYWMIGIALAVAELITPVHYWPVTPIQFGLIVVGPAYALTSLAAGLREDQSFRRALVEPIITLSIIWGIAAIR